MVEDSRLPQPHCFMNIRKIVAAKIAVGALLALTAYARTVRTAQTLAARDRQHPPRHSY